MSETIGLIMGLISIGVWIFYIGTSNIKINPIMKGSGVVYEIYTITMISLKVLFQLIGIMFIPISLSLIETVAVEYTTNLIDFGVLVGISWRIYGLFTILWFFLNYFYFVVGGGMYEVEKSS